MADRSKKIEQWLDAGLGHYADAAPRAGLEGRLLAAIQAEQQRPGYWLRRWQFRWVVATILVAGAALFLKPRTPMDGPHPRSTASASNLEIRVQTEIPPVVTSHKTVRVAGTSTPRTHLAGAAYNEDPRLDVFPSPQPLTEQEEMLARYVREQKQEAVMVARARAALENKEFLSPAQQLPSVERLRNSQQ